jgi:hypothetical protein
MPTPTVTSEGNFMRPFNESDQDSPNQGSQGLVKGWDKRLNVQGDYVEK